jgi:hypothetical protein
VVALATAAPAVPAAASVTSKQLSYSPRGSIDYVWTGVPSRGCAQAGLCGVTGSLQVIPESASTIGSPSIEVTDGSSVVRVEYSGSPARICVDPMAYDVNFRLTGRHAGAPQPYADLSAGQCAGPVAGDLAAVRLPVRREANGDYDLSGSQSFGAGPFEVRGCRRSSRARPSSAAGRVRPRVRRPGSIQSLTACSSSTRRSTTGSPM